MLFMVSATHARFLANRNGEKVIEVNGDHIGNTDASQITEGSMRSRNAEEFRFFSKSSYTWSVVSVPNNHQWIRSLTVFAS
ncbi:hypothetical protein POX_g09032 [Penicillium oxalicum]|uniref:hypothetical protein n=1 Tax=Penicillium oxalicum TaxID=69781 RepID=UPI0020B7E37C|nr:hypothetical protein POX_g09032 [Penicillium oxalicum]KAI2786644.1 hypothetical protein POX_g09032 [Penicillium oxalicum]